MSGLIDSGLYYSDKFSGVPFVNSALRSGFSFGLTSGIITALGVLVGIGAGTDSKMVVVGALLTIALADSFSDALAVFTLEESEHTRLARRLAYTALTAFIAKLLFSASFILPVLILPLASAIVISVIWGVICLSVLSFYTARLRKEAVVKSVLLHVGIAVAVIIGTGLIGWAVRTWVS